MKGRTIRCIETGEVFESLREASAKLNIPYSTLDGGLRRYGGICQFGIRELFTLTWETYKPDKDEEFRPIPGYEGLYKISNKKNVYSEVGKRLLKPATIKSTKQQAVVLYLNGIPSTFTLARLYRMAWPENVPEVVVNNLPASNKSKPITCVTENREFPSYIECCKAYSFDYQEFRKAVRKAIDKKFSYKGKEFELA